MAIVPIALIFLATQLPSLQRGLLTTPLTGPQWLAAIGLALALPLVIEAGKWIRRRRAPEPARARRRAGGRSVRALNETTRMTGAVRIRRSTLEEMTGMAKHKHETEQSTAEPPPRMKEKEYQHELRRLHGELVALQEWVKSSGAKVCVVFEGRDTAGKGGTIKAITERVSPRVFRVVALPAPTEREKSQMYVQRYIPHLPAGGEVVIFDRSWYNRAGVERVMGFCTDEQAERFLEQVPAVEKAMLDSGIRLIKYWLEVSADEQTRRLESRIDDPRKIWKLSDMDLASYARWDDYSRARDEMFAATNTAWAPWYVAHTDDKKRARLNIITHLLGQIPYDGTQAQEDHAARARRSRRHRGHRPVHVHPHAVLKLRPERPVGWSGCQHDLARNVLGRLGHERLARVRQREDGADVGAQRPVVDESSDLAELGTVRVPDETHRADVAAIGRRLRP